MNAEHLTVAQIHRRSVICYQGRLPVEIPLSQIRGKVRLGTKLVYDEATAAFKFCWSAANKRLLHIIATAALIAETV